MTDLLTRVGLRRMVARDANEAHRVATPLELLFDLVFVVAVSQASQNLHHLLSEDHLREGLVGYLMVFFAIWWAWMNFSWFASAFDTDDWLYRVTTILQMAGVLVLAAGVHAAMVEQDFTIVTWGYVIMRLAMVMQWLRAAASSTESRGVALRFAAGITVVQVLWVGRMYLLDDAGQFWTFWVLMVAELLVPVWAENSGGEGHGTSWHPHHISERYGLFTLLLLGESLLASANAIIDALSEGEHVPQLIALSAMGIVVAAGMWWTYFARDQAETLAESRAGFRFGYAHYLIFAAAGAVSAGIEVVIDLITGHTELSDLVAGLTLTVPIGVFVLAVWVTLLRTRIAGWASTSVVILAVLIVGCALVPAVTLVATAILVALIVVVLEVDAARPALVTRASAP